jgi:hypothetical protein
MVCVPERIGCRPVRIADRLGVHCASTLKFEVQQLQPLIGDLVDAWRRRAAQYPAAVAAELTPAEVVPEEHHDVRLLIGHVIPLTFRSVLG